MQTKNADKKVISAHSVRVHVLIDILKEVGGMSGVGFEPTPTRVDCDLNAAP